jgi:hypothetical protein
MARQRQSAVAAHLNSAAHLQASRDAPHEGGGLVQEVIKVELDPCAGVTAPLGPEDVKVSHYYPGAQLQPQHLLLVSPTSPRCLA